MTSNLTPGSRWNWSRVAVFAGVLVAFVVLVLAMLAAMAQRGEARPGTRLDGVDVGGLGRTDLLTVAKRTASERQARVITVTAADGTATVSARSVGVKVDPDETADAALDARRGGLTAPFKALGAWVGAGHDVAPVADLSKTKLSRETARIEDELTVQASDGGFTVRTAGKATTVTVAKPRTGVALESAAVSKELRAALLSGRKDTVQLSATLDEPAAGIDAARAVTVKARTLLTDDFVLRDGKRALTLTPAQLGPALRAEADGKGGLRLGVDAPVLRTIVATEAKPLVKPARALRLRSPSPGVLLTAQGDATYAPRPVTTSVSGGRSGYAVDVDATVTAIGAAAADGRRSTALPGKVTPVPTDDGDLGAIDQVIGSFTTYFPCCAPRVTNINRMADIVDGTVVEPGETFSLNAIVGPRTLEGGFVKDHAIVGDRLEEQVGGGVSQFSTTMLNAVWFAGLPSLQHQPHTAYISRYPAVREATLDFGTIDNRWRNTTLHPVVVRTVAGPGSVTVALYGHTGDREVTSITSKRTNTKGGGFKATVTRTVRDGDDVTKQDGLAWTYRGPLKTEAEIKKEEEAKKKAAKKKADAAAKAKASASPTPTPPR